jgi:hypothetical protein
MRMRPSALLAAAKAMPKALQVPQHPFRPTSGAKAFVTPEHKVTNQFQPPDQVQRENANLSPMQQFMPPTNSPGPTAFQRPAPNAMKPQLPGDKMRLVPKGSPL